MMAPMIYTPVYEHRMNSFIISCKSLEPVIDLYQPNGVVSIFINNSKVRDFKPVYSMSANWCIISIPSMYIMTRLRDIS